MKRALAKAKCGCGKTTYTSYKRARRAVASAGANRPYWCAEAGGYHITRYTKAENARRQQEGVELAEKRAERERKVQEHRLRMKQQRSNAATGKRSRRAC